MQKPRHGPGPVTREKLIEAAGEMFAEKGLHATSIRDITQRAGANIAAVNYHFRDKFELYALVLRQAHQPVAQAINQPLTAATPEGRIRELIAALLTSALDPRRPRWHRLLLGRELLEPTPALDLLYDIMQRPSQRLWEAVRDIRPDLAKEQLMLAVSAVMALCVFHVHHGHLPHRMFAGIPEPSVEALVENVLEFSLAGMRGLPALAAKTGARRGTSKRNLPARRAVAGRKSASARNHQ